MGSGASIGEELEEEGHSPKTQQLIELAGRLAEERGIGDDQTVRFPDSLLGRLRRCALRA